MDLTNFPHDTQKCEIQAESYGFTRNTIDLKWGQGIPAVGVSPNYTESEFDVQMAKPEVFYTEFVSGTYSTLLVRLYFHRRFGYYARQLYAPFITLVLLSWLSFWIKAKAKYIRLTLLLVIMYLTLTIASELEPAFPKTPYTKASDVWTAFCEVMVLAAFLEFIASCILAVKSDGTSTSAKHKGEIMCSLDPEGKETHASIEHKKLGVGKYFVMFRARNGEQDSSNRIDRISRVVFPMVFFLFNIIYWAVCCS